MAAIRPMPAATRPTPARPWHNIATVALLALGLVWLTQGYFRTTVIDGGDMWTTGDWLINYAGGMVRRGAIGEMVRRMHLAGPPATWTLFAIQSGIYTALFTIVIRLYLRRNRAGEWALLLLSPAFLMFPVRGFEGGFRKEILGLLAVALIAWAATRNRSATPLIALSAAIYGLATVSHELNAFFAPMALFFLYLCWRFETLSRPEFIRWSLVFAALSLAGIATGLALPGSLAISEAVCASLIALGFEPEICGGAILWLRYDLTLVREILSAFNPRYLLVYSAYAAAAFAPFVLVRSARMPVLLVFLVLPLAPLYFIFIDWGRLIHIQIFFLTLALLTLSTREDVSIRPLHWIAIVLYILAWNLPHCCRGFDADPIIEAYDQRNPARPPATN